LRRIEGERHAVLAGRQGRVERDADELLVTVAALSSRFRQLDAGARHLQRVGIEPEQRGAAIELDVDCDFALRGRLARHDR
jgi:hypothetical protein